MLTLLILLQVAGAGAQPAATADDLAWLTGCWEFTRGNRHVVEHWTPPEGRTLIGVSRTVSDGKTVDYEFLIIRESGGRLEYVAKPARQPEAVFTSASLTKDSVVFENPKHDFPTRISYRRQSDDALVAKIEGKMDGKDRAIEFPYRRAACSR